MKKRLVCIIAGAALLASCVPSGEFSQLSDKSNALQHERDQLMAENEFLTVENREMKARVGKVEDQQEQLVRDSIRIYKKVEELEQEVASLERKYSDLESAHEALLRGNARETRRLLNELQTAQEDLARKEQLLKQLESNVNQQKQDVTLLQAELEERNARLMEMEELLHEKDRILDELKSKVAEALLGFEGQGLTVTRKDGKVYVSLEEKLLFKTGSTEVDPNGVRALKQLAVVLGNNPEINIMDLSVMRATSIVRILLEDPGIAPTRITAAGRGEFLPVDPADTPEARRKNRRTEIILSPDFTELFRILDM
jgi:chemotaxis protein MotB